MNNIEENINSANYYVHIGKKNVVTAKKIRDRNIKVSFRILNLDLALLEKSCCGYMLNYSYNYFIFSWCCSVLPLSIGRMSLIWDLDISNLKEMPLLCHCFTTPENWEKCFYPNTL